MPAPIGSRSARRRGIGERAFRAPFRINHDTVRSRGESVQTKRKRGLVGIPALTRSIHDACRLDLNGEAGPVPGWMRPRFEAERAALLDRMGSRPRLDRAMREQPEFEPPAVMRPDTAPGPATCRPRSSRARAARGAARPRAAPAPAGWRAGARGRCGIDPFGPFAYTARNQQRGPAMTDRPTCFQDILMRLQAYWARQGCAVLQPYDMEVGAGTFHPATTLRALGSKAWAAAYVQPSRRPTDGRYGENPNRLQHYYQYQVLIKPSPANLQELYLGSLEAIGIEMDLHDIRFVEDDWESPTLGAWGLGWEVWCDGMEVSQFTYFQQVGGHDCKPVSGELTYGLERLAMYVLNIDHVMDMPFNDPQSPQPLTYGDVFRQTEGEYSRFNFDQADTGKLLQHFEDAEAECQAILAAPYDDPKTGKRIVMAHPAYDQCIKASHLFNLLDARGVISVTERQAYIGRVRALAKMCADAFVQTEAGGYAG